PRAKVTGPPMANATYRCAAKEEDNTGPAAGASCGGYLQRLRRRRCGRLRQLAMGNGGGKGGRRRHDRGGLGGRLRARGPPRNRPLIRWEIVADRLAAWQERLARIQAALDMLRELARRAAALEP